ncbi:MAG: NAD(P)-dependent alcohol dehydrogenase [Solirubrobacterales bacterium]|nr:NAD(P)-dependent alcohol dehydrogenase [Solirubrobacterales bacterium]
MNIRAAVTESKGAPFTIRDLELDRPRDGEVLVSLSAAGICHTDLIIRDQWYPVPLPAVLGHEGAGMVEAVGPGVTKVAPGDHVAMSYGSCGGCPNCRLGHPWVCHDFWGRNFGATRPDGTTSLRLAGEPVHSHFFSQSSFATKAIATEGNLTKLDESVPLEIVAPFGCGIQTGAGAVLNALQPPAGTSIAVFGTGTVGLAAVMAALVAGCTTIIGIDVRPERLAVAQELGATAVVDARAGDTVEAIKDATGGLGADFSIETTGSPEVLAQAVYCTSPGGTCGLVGAPPFGAEVSLDVNQVMALGRSLRGIVEGESVPDVFLPRLIELWQQGRFPVDRIITHYDFDAIDQAAHDAEEGRVIKPVLRF